MGELKIEYSDKKITPFGYDICSIFKCKVALISRNDNLLQKWKIWLNYDVDF